MAERYVFRVLRTFRVLAASVPALAVAYGCSTFGDGGESASPNGVGVGADASADDGGPLSDAAPSEDAAPSASFGAPEIFASAQAGCREIAADGEAVYWMRVEPSGTFEVVRAAITDRAPQVLRGGQQRAHELAVNASNLFWLASSSAGAASYLWASSKTSSTAEARVVQLDANGPDAFANLDVRGSLAVWTTTELTAPTLRLGVFRKDADSAATPTLVASIQFGLRAVAAAAPYVYWATGDTIFRSASSEDVGPAEVVAINQVAVSSLLIDGTTVFATRDDGAVIAIDAPGAVPRTLAIGQGGPKGLTSDASNVYWVNASGGEVVTAAKAGGAPLVLARANEPFDVAVNASAVYFSARGSGEIMSVPKR